MRWPHGGAITTNFTFWPVTFELQVSGTNVCFLDSVGPDETIYLQFSRLFFSHIFCAVITKCSTEYLWTKLEPKFLSQIFEIQNIEAVL